MTDYIIVGNGVAGTTAAEQIRKLDANGSITLLADEDMPFYWRIQLNEFISGDLEEEKLLAKKADWYEQTGIDLQLHTRVVGGSPADKTLRTADDRLLHYDQLLIATGSHSFIPPIDGAERAGVFALRSLQDAHAIRTWAARTDTVVLIGGGLLGLEAGNALRKLGKRIMVVEFFPRLLPRQLDSDGALRLQAIMEGMGFSFRLGARTQSINGAQEVENVLLQGGEALPAGMVVVSAGVRPNLELVEPFGLQADKGIQVDEHLRTNQPDIYAAGDVAEFNGIPYGIWQAAMEQGRIAGTNMAGGQAAYSGTTMANKLKVVGVDLASAGEIDADNEHESLVRSTEGVYRKIVLQDDVIIGCIMLGDTEGFNRITQMMAEKKNVAGMKEDLLS